MKLDAHLSMCRSPGYLCDMAGMFPHKMFVYVALKSKMATMAGHIFLNMKLSEE
jgi:hypothetical protein